MRCNHIKNNLRKCKNNCYKLGLCYIHSNKKTKNTKKVSFNENLNTTIVVPRYINNLKKLDDGRWYYQDGYNPRCFKNVKYDYTTYGKYFL